MRKVIVAFEVPHFSEGAMRFVSQMNEAEHVSIAGIFLPKPAFTAFQTADLMTPGMFLPFVEEISTADLNECVQKFRRYCSDNHLRYEIIENKIDFGLPELREQSRYADLIVVGGSSFFNLPDS